MKKGIVWFLLATVLLTATVGCADSKDGTVMSEATQNDYIRPEEGRPSDGEPGGGNSVITSIPEGLTGTDVAKLLLAEQRLNSHLLDTEDDIFENGVETYENLARMAQKSLDGLNVAALTPRYSASAPLTLQPVASTLTQRAMTEIGADDISEFSRDYEVFRSTAELIVSNAEAGADMIDHVKKYVRVVDMWVSHVAVEGEELYLHVEENSETIYSRYNGRINVCRRFKNEKGQDVYELLQENSFETIRSTYISGELYEFSRRFADMDRYDVMVAQNTKGYWEVFSNISTRDEVYFPGEVLHSPQFFMMKEDISYAFMNLYRDGVQRFSLVNDARTSDIISEQLLEYDDNLQKYRMTYSIKPAAFTGVAGALLDSEFSGSAVLLENGQRIEMMTYYRDGEKLPADVGVGDYDLYVNHLPIVGTAWGTEVEVYMEVFGDSIQDCRQILKDQLARWGLVCKYGDADFLFAQLDRAYQEAEAILSYHKWLGYSTADAEGLTQALEIEKSRFAALDEMRDAVKDAPVVSMTDREAYELAIRFAPIVAQTGEGVALNGRTVSLSSLELAINDSLLFVKDTEYAIFFALKPVDGSGLIHIDVENPQTVAYDGSSSFRVAMGGASFALPVVEAGEYTLVVYIGLADGVRASDCVAVAFDTVAADALRSGAAVMTASKADDGSLRILWEENFDVYVSLSGDASVDYQALYEMIAGAGYSYGLVSGVIERLGADGGYTAMSGEETSIADGTYRLGYTVQNGETVTAGYIYADYVVEVPEQETPSAEI